MYVKFQVGPPSTEIDTPPHYQQMYQLHVFLLYHLFLLTAMVTLTHELNFTVDGDGKLYQARKVVKTCVSC